MYTHATQSLLTEMTRSVCGASAIHQHPVGCSLFAADGIREPWLHGGVSSFDTRQGFSDPCLISTSDRSAGLFSVPIGRVPEPHCLDQEKYRPVTEMVCGKGHTSGRE